MEEKHPRPQCACAHHAQVVHEAGSVLPDERGGAAERLHADLLTAVQLPHGAHHHVNGVKHQGRRQLERNAKTENQTGSDGGSDFLTSPINKLCGLTVAIATETAANAQIDLNVEFVSLD